MGCMLVCIATAVTGIDVGWEKRPDGGYEYTIQIEPHLLDALKKGESIRSEIDPKLRHVRNYRIICGEGDLRRDPVPPESSGSPSDGTPEANMPEESPPSMEPEKPWFAFWLVSGIAAGFFWAFVYLLWIHADTRRRYRTLVAEFYGSAGVTSDSDLVFTQTDSPAEP